MPAAYLEFSGMLDEMTGADIPLDATEAYLSIMAMQCAEACTRVMMSIHEKGLARERMEAICGERGIEPPKCERPKSQRDADPKKEADIVARAVIARCCDPRFWRRRLKVKHARALEHAGMRLGRVSKFAGLYISDESAARYAKQQTRNANWAEATTLESVQEGGEVCRMTLAEIMVKTPANRVIRANEVLVRIRGMEDYAHSGGWVGVFVTLTAPSKYHAVLSESGEVNPAYIGTSARDAQDYLQKVWTRIRAAYGRLGIRPLGMRIAEPHHDGCPHWHLLLFMPSDQEADFSRIMRRYALAEDGQEKGAQENRVKIIRIEASQGTATGYILKYVLKNTGDKKLAHKDAGMGLQKNVFGDEELQPGERVQAWASKWSIRQFQAIGEPPITVYREFRRIKAEAVEGGTDAVQQAHYAIQKDAETGKRVDYCAYLKLQGVCMGRDYRFRMLRETKVVNGRYEMAERRCPVGIYDAWDQARPEQPYRSVRYEWRTVAKVAEAFPWTRVNNCTPPAWAAEVKGTNPIAEFDDSGWFASDEFREIAISEGQMLDLMDHAQQQAREYRKYGRNHARKN
ncbi:replication endonuclease [Herbaspirillum huttiense]|uniref:replication endonuclease n=1 Tax=Herbaspirillum huttiense TaxID=863372 RepID=UPI003F36789E